MSPMIHAQARVERILLDIYRRSLRTVRIKTRNTFVSVDGDHHKRKSTDRIHQVQL
ncbi:hypothetical protein RUE5091_00142 [Ruegeria denitrificans]|uniref:Uncharacterized protein n=1 Tax=Ruegeria denitrificans TaxID=1715692 RepID=A0A0P1I0V7_9RHOB|nr:hypothetical protein RUE5091_00142 [Ruegeria denitrificans]